MKNIHLMQVNKAVASLYHCSNTRDLFTTRQTPDDLLYEIYITSDEYIGFSYYIDDTNTIRKGVVDDKEYWEARKEYKKIILTTNQDLIKDGVQAIDDEFLQWFVKNPLCIDSAFKSNFVGEYYDDKIQDLTFSWKKDNNHWNKS